MNLAKIKDLIALVSKFDFDVGLKVIFENNCKIRKYYNFRIPFLTSSEVM